MTDFETKFDDIMRFARFKVPQKKKISSKEDLHRYLKNIDDNRRDQKSPKKFSDNFLHGLINTRGAARTINEGSVGHFGKAERVQSARIERYRAEGRELRAYQGNRLAVKFAYTRGNRAYVSYRDVDTGRFVSKQNFR